MDGMNLDLLNNEQRDAVLELLDGDYSLENREEVVKYQESVLSVGKWISKPSMNTISVELLAEALGVDYDDYFKKAELYEDLTDYLDNDWSDENKIELLSHHLYKREVGLEWREFIAFNNVTSEELMKELNLSAFDVPEGYIYLMGEGIVRESKVNGGGKVRKNNDRDSDKVSSILPVDYEAMMRYAFNTKDYEWLEELIRESYANKTFKEILEYSVENENYELAAYIKKNYTEWMD